MDVQFFIVSIEFMTSTLLVLLRLKITRISLALLHFGNPIASMKLISARYGTHEGAPQYDTNCDVDGDGDIVNMCIHYGETYP